MISWGESIHIDDTHPGDVHVLNVAIEAGDPTMIPNGQVGLFARPRVWGQVLTVAGTSAEAYTTFVKEVLDTYTSVVNP